MRITLGLVAVTAPFLLQGLAMVFDEGYYHHRRGLPQWERIGHPLDTITLLLAFGWIAWTPMTTGSIWVYGILGVFSSIFITKDEGVHTQYCSAGEQWLHSVLFVLHPCAIIAGALLWPVIHPSYSLVGITHSLTTLSQDLNVTAAGQSFFLGQLALMAAFFLYQVTYWNFFWKKYELTPRQ